MKAKSLAPKILTHEQLVKKMTKKRREEEKVEQQEEGEWQE